MRVSDVDRELRIRAEQWVQRIERDAVYPHLKGQGLPLDLVMISQIYYPGTKPSPRVYDMMRLLAWLETLFA